MVLGQFEEIAKDANYITAFSIANTFMNLVTRLDDGK
jgi:hypothetical protein